MFGLNNTSSAGSGPATNSLLDIHLCVDDLFMQRDRFHGIFMSGNVETVHRISLSHIAIDHIHKLKWTHWFKGVAKSLDPCPPVYLHAVLVMTRHFFYLYSSQPRLLQIRYDFVCSWISAAWSKLMAGSKIQVRSSALDSIWHEIFIVIILVTCNSWSTIITIF